MVWLLMLLTIAMELSGQDGPPKASRKDLWQATTAVAVDTRNMQAVGLSAEQIAVRGVDAKAERVEPLTGPRRIVLLLDLSPSSRQSSVRWNNTMQVARDMLKYRQTRDYFALHAFGTKSEELCPFTQDPSTIDEALSRLGSQGDSTVRQTYGIETNVVAAIERSLSKAKPDVSLGDVIVLVSDGIFRDFGGKNVESMQRELIRAGIRLYLLLTTEISRLSVRVSTSGAEIPPSIQGSLESITRDLERDFLTAITRAQQRLVIPTGGAIVNPGETTVEMPDTDPAFSQARVAFAIRALSLLIHGAYRVDLELKQPISRPRPITLALREKTAKNVVLLYPHWILPAEHQERK